MYFSLVFRYVFLLVVPLVLIVLSGGIILAKQVSKPTDLLPAVPLKENAKRYSIDIGNFAIKNHINDDKYASILTSQFNLALLDNTPNWYFTDGGLRPTINEYNFNHMDEVVSFAERHNMAMQAHHYVWGEEKWLPEWLKNGNYSKEELLNIIKDHIYTVGKRYSGKIQEWTVVNEAHSRGQNYNNLRDWWQDATGDKEYIDYAFKWAREADPSAKLILNDFGNETYSTISEEMHSYIRNALARGIPIDGIGMQMHIDGSNPPSKQEVIDNMKRFGNLGIKVYVTEFDVNMSSVKGSQRIRDNKQAIIYYDMARACIESDVCNSFSILGITDKETWYTYLGYTDPDPLLFDENYNPKPSFCALYSAFNQYPKILTKEQI
jgi:endo-1,4-beta-xylanase